jgi:pSer/pThr/pTyr-binding forkhead associated (FHA) protein
MSHSPRANGNAVSSFLRAQAGDEGDRPRPKNFFPLSLTLVPSGLTLKLSRLENLVGRHSECDLRLALSDVSRRHCRIFFRDGVWHIEDCGSLNGVYVNDERVTGQQLHPFDVLEIGGFRLVVMPPEVDQVKQSRAA